MSLARKPGIDTLIFFWLAICLWIAGWVLSVLPVLYSFAGNGENNPIAPGTLGMIAVFCFAAAAVISIVVLHKVIAMLVYLVHKKP